MTAADLLAMQQSQNDSILAQQKKLINNTADHNVAERTRTGERQQVDNYVGWQNDLRNAGQQLSAMGLSGGPSETSLLNRTNNYRNNRMTTDSEMNSDNAATRLQQQSDLAAAQQEYALRNTDYLSQYYSNSAAEQAAAAAAAAASSTRKGTGTKDTAGEIEDADKYNDALTYAKRLQMNAASSGDYNVQSSQWFVQQLLKKGYSAALIAQVMNDINAR